MMNIKRFFRAFHKAVKEEIEEVVTLNVTKEDEEQASKIANLTADTMMMYGVPVGGAGRAIMKKVIAYSLRDIKDGVNAPDKLIIRRVINELKEESKDV
jgi:hypothetical protein